MRHRRKRNGSARSDAIQTNPNRRVALASLSSYMIAHVTAIDSKRSTGPALRIFRYLKTSQRRTKIEVVGTRSHSHPARDLGARLI